MLKHKHRFFQFMRFCTVGLGNTAVDFGAFFLLTRAAVPYLIAQILSYSLGVLNSYWFNRSWTFRVANRANLPELARFIVVNGLSLLVSTGLLYLTQEMAQMGVWPGKLVATGGAVMVNFIGSRIWVFAKNPTITGDVL